MTEICTSRRRWFALTALATIGVGLPTFLTKRIHPQDWMTTLKWQLHGISSWMRTEQSESEVRIDCGTEDCSKWAEIAGDLAGVGQKVRCNGNELRFICEGKSVLIVIHPELA